MENGTPSHVPTSLVLRGILKVTFLGHVVSPEGIRTDPEKVKAVETWHVPLNVEELQSIIGLASYYRRFTCGFSGIAEPFYKLCRKDVPFSR